MNLQRTLRRAVTVRGIGLHSGRPVELTLNPAAENHGIVFVRTDLDGQPRIRAHFTRIVDTRLATTLGENGATISTVEHVLAALAGMGVDNALIEVSAAEVPILDGSSVRWVRAIERAGVESQAHTRSVLVLRKRLEVKGEGKWAVIEPSARFEVEETIEWNHPSIGTQSFHFVDGRTSFSELAGARTFCMLKDVEAMQARGLARGGSLDNAVVMSEDAVLNPDGLRYPDEFVRHKVLDAIGDFALAGVHLQGYFRLHKAGHDFHSQLLKELFSDPDHFELIEGVPVPALEEHATGLRGGVAPKWAATV